MAPSGQTSKEYFTTLTIIHAGLLIVQVLFGTIAYFLKSKGMFDTNDEGVGKVLMFIAPVIVLGGIAASILVGKRQVNRLKALLDLKEKLSGYRTSLLIKLALLEMPALVAVVCFLLTGMYFFLGLAAITIAVFFMNRPTLHGLAMELELNPSERKTIEDPNSIVG